MGARTRKRRRGRRRHRPLWQHVLRALAVLLLIGAAVGLALALLAVWLLRP